MGAEPHMPCLGWAWWGLLAEGREDTSGWRTKEVRTPSPREYPSLHHLEALTTPHPPTSQGPGFAAPGQLGPELRLLTQHELGTEGASQVFDE